MTDALARQQIQRWTVQLAAPEYLGAHVSAPRSHQTGRTLPLDFRAATALFGSFGIEWDLTRAGPAELAALREWVQRYRTYRGLLHSGRTVRVSPATRRCGCTASSRPTGAVRCSRTSSSTSRSAIAASCSGCPGLRAEARYGVSWAGPVDDHRMSQAPPVDPAGPTGGVAVSGAVLRDVGVWVPRRRPETILLMHLEEVL